MCKNTEMRDLRAKDQNVLICMHPIFVFILFKYIPIAGVRTYRSMHPVVYLLEKQRLSIHGGGLFFGCVVRVGFHSG